MIVVSITLTLITWKKIKKYHLLYLIIGYFLYYCYDNSYTLVEHGGYNIMFLILISLSLFIIYTCFIVFTKYREKRWGFIVILILITVVLPLIFYIYISSITSCENFDLGYNNTRIIN